MWTMMLARNGGVINELFALVGLPDNIHWLGNMNLVIWTVTLVNTWMFAGHNMLYFLAGLASIPGEIIEASTIDGASGPRRMWYIILPCAKESFKTFLVLSVTACIRVFDIIFVMTQGGPGTASEVPATLLYRHSFLHNAAGYGASIGVVMLVLSMCLAFGLQKLFNRMDK
jgi:raffinose/stachyose/melibiose transport system permease protein